MESHPQNPGFRNNPENFHPCLYTLATFIANRSSLIGRIYVGGHYILLHYTEGPVMQKKA